MKSISRFLQFVAQFITLGLALAFIVTLFAPQWAEGLRTRLNPPTPVDTVSFGPAKTDANTGVASSKPTAQELSLKPIIAQEREGAGDTITYSYSRAVDRAAPAVVSIYANKQILSQQFAVPTNPEVRAKIGAIPVGPQFMRTTRSAGSGVIFNSDGYVLTNEHVIRGAEEIQAVLGDGRLANAKLVGKDIESDLAVLKLDIGHLPVIPVSDRIPDVGDVALAIGSPFGLGNTVTMGIVSARGRQLGPTSEDMIQTDAAINSGNSGGALVNAFGELIGINSEAYTPGGAGGSVGIGFAIPVNTAKTVLTQILEHGRVIRGWMGADYVDVLPTPLASTSTPMRGVVVRSVAADTPAAGADMQPGDQLLEFEDRPIAGQLDLHTRESELAPGSKIHVSGLRNGKFFSSVLTLTEKPQAEVGTPSSG